METNDFQFCQKIVILLGFQMLKVLTRTFIVALVTFVWAKQEREKKRRNPSEERKGEAGGGKAAFNVKYGIFDFKT